MKIFLFDRRGEPWINPSAEIPDFHLLLPPYVMEGGLLFAHIGEYNYKMVQMVWDLGNQVMETHYLPDGEDYIAVCGKDLREVGIGSAVSSSMWITCPLCRSRTEGV